MNKQSLRGETLLCQDWPGRCLTLKEGTLFARIQSFGADNHRTLMPKGVCVL
jgi:hypothetical protein